MKKSNIMRVIIVSETDDNSKKTMVDEIVIFIINRFCEKVRRFRALNAFVLNSLSGIKCGMVHVDYI